MLEHLAARVLTISPYNSFTARAMTPILSKSNGPGRSQHVSRISPYHTTSSALEANIR